MLRFDQVRCWRQAALYGLLCLSVPGLGLAQTETSTPPQKTEHALTATSKSKPQTSTHQTSTHQTSKSHTTAHSSSKTTSAAAKKSKTSHGKKGSKQVAKKHGQQAIDADRTREIQTALIREHYMQGEPSGSWDTETQAAMQRYQADQGWQAKTIPDSRALIKLGLGPSNDHLLNPENAMTTAPAAKGTAAGKSVPQQ